MPQISVIVPVYKVEPFLRRCVDSILGQTFTDFELILVDDGSPDNCGAICDEYAAKDSRVVVIHQQNGGLSAARNAGLDWVFANSDSEWITFIDSDDWVHKEYLERLYTATIDNDVNISVCGYIRTDGEEPVITAENFNIYINDSESFFIEQNTNATIACGKLYKKTCFQNIRYPIGKIHEDEFTTYKILLTDKKLAFIPAPMYFYYINSEGITKSPVSFKRMLNRSDALFEQYIYFSEFCTNQHAEFIADSYIDATFNLLYKFQNNGHMNTGLLKHRRHFRVLLHKYRYKYRFKDNVNLFEQAYPKALRLYWYGKAIFRKFNNN